MMKLFEKGQIGSMGLQNRVVMAPMGIDYIDPDGGFSEQAIEYYVARAKGGTGLIITGACAVTTEFYPPYKMFVFDSPDKADRVKKMLDKIHAAGGKLCLQLSLGSGNIGYIGPNNPANTKEEIRRMIEAFGNAALLAKNTGVDAIEVHGYGGYLIDQFQTALWNSRTDEYGGNLDGRLKIAMELIEEVRKKCGNDYPLIYKFSPTHLIPGGREMEEGVEMAKRLEAAGVTALHVDVGCHACWHNAIPTIYQKAGLHAETAGEIKKAVKIPVISHGKLGNPEVAEKVLEDGKADFIALGHASLTDPEWANKVKENRLDDIVPCIGCNECMLAIMTDNPVSCGVNPQCGKEKEYEIIPALEAKSILVVGGGPGGMEAALVAAKRGHKVSLWEKKEQLGGNLVPASAPDFKKDLVKLINYYKIQLQKWGVAVSVNKKYSPEDIIAFNPDAVILSTGSNPIIPDIPGIANRNVFSAVDVFTDENGIGDNIVVAGGGFVGCELAVHLTKKGKKVTIIEMQDKILPEPMALNNMIALQIMIMESGVKVMTGTKLMEIKPGAIVVEKAGEKTEDILCDSVILALGFRPDNTLANALQGKINNVFVIGDASKPRRVKQAVTEGFETALAL